MIETKLRTLPIALDGTLPACCTVHSQVSSQDALNHTPEHALKYTLNYTRWHTPSLLHWEIHPKYYSVKAPNDFRTYKEKSD